MITLTMAVSMKWVGLCLVVVLVLFVGTIAKVRNDQISETR